MIGSKGITGLRGCTGAKGVLGRTGASAFDPLAQEGLIGLWIADQSEVTYTSGTSINTIENLVNASKPLVKRTGAGITDVTYEAISVTGNPAWRLSGARSELRVLTAGFSTAVTLIAFFQPLPTRTINNGVTGGFLATNGVMGFTAAGAPFYVREETPSSITLSDGLINDTEPHMQAISISDASNAIFYTDGEVSANFDPDNAYQTNNMRFGDGGNNSPECDIFCIALLDQGVSKEKLDEWYAWGLG